VVDVLYSGTGHSDGMTEMTTVAEHVAAGNRVVLRWPVTGIRRDPLDGLPSSGPIAAVLRQLGILAGKP
jgi:hypothetical protein